ncbi:MAG: pre-hexon-linking protein VIII [psittacine adenovirus 7]|uniref:Pre-hexon-linking protein VIII n=1 Tax=psittacine adenovirus 7 TaxID=2848040 RepID=A0A6B9LXQ8_9ADEN|nr:MAG: pre-hexon-linking protein VIII [psittacine adenovirus 7]QHB43564.1 MAG: pre-hexon-linking protein VIII [psittacine adenovirus 7]
MDPAPTEYLWQYNPVTGRVAGANQNYGERINILHANRYLYNRMQDVQRASNRLVTERGLKSLTGGSFMHFVPADYKTSDLERLEGGSLPFTDQASTDHLKRLADIVLHAEEKKVDDNDLLTTTKFVKGFPPVVYEDPFSGDNFAYEFSPLFNPKGNEFTNLPFSGGAISLTGDHPKLRGGAVILAGQSPALGNTPIRL